MAYIGQSIKNGTFTTLDTSGNTYNGSNTAFALGTQVGSPAQLLVSHDGVIQKPGTDYTLSSGGTAITFTTAPASGASIFIVEISGAVGGPLGSDLNGSELILDADGDTSIHASTDDQIDIKIAGADDFKFTANAMNVLSGSTLTVDSGATITNSGTANGFAKIGQVISAQFSSGGASSTSTTFVDTPLTLDITPSATSSKILIMYSLNIAKSGGDCNNEVRITRGGSQIQLQGGLETSSSADLYIPFTNHFLDSPSSESLQTYLVQFHRGAGSGTVSTNITSSRQAQLTLMEILA